MVQWVVVVQAAGQSVDSAGFDLYPALHRIQAATGGITALGDQSLLAGAVHTNQRLQQTGELAAALTIDTLRTFFLVVLSILGPLSFALSIYDGFQPTLTNWISRYISIYLWLPVADLFSAVLSKIQELMLKTDIALLQNPSYVPDGSNGVYIVFLIIGIIGYFSIPTVAGWIIQAGGGSSFNRNVNTAAAKGAALAGGVAGSAAGNVAGRLLGK